MSWNLVAAGLVVGFFIGLSGVGSGALLAPVLLLLGVPPVTVVGSDLAFGLVTKGAGVGVHVRRGTVRWRWVWWMARGSVPGALLGALLLARLAGSPHAIRLAIAAMLVVAPLLAVAADVARRRSAARGGTWVDRMRRPRPWGTTGVGFIVGVAVGATSVGSGSLIDIALVLCSPLAGAEIVGTGIAHAVLLSAVAAAAHWHLGTVSPALVLTLAAGSVPGVLLGAMLATRSPSRTLRWGVTALVFLSGVHMLTSITRS